MRMDCLSNLKNCEIKSLKRSGVSLSTNCLADQLFRSHYADILQTILQTVLEMIPWHRITLQIEHEISSSRLRGKITFRCSLVEKNRILRSVFGFQASKLQV